jgi:hypothetical protein
VLNVVPPRIPDYTELTRRLDRLEQRIARIDEHVAHQLLVISRLEAGGLPSHAARGILRGFDEIRAQCIAEREQVRSMLNDQASASLRRRERIRSL